MNVRRPLVVVGCRLLLVVVRLLRSLLLSKLLMVRSVARGHKNGKNEVGEPYRSELLQLTRSGRAPAVLKEKDPTGATLS